MRKFIFILIMILLGGAVYSQHVRYGYPTRKDELQKGDILILNIPPFTDCRFINVDDFNNFIELLKINKLNTLKIEINYFYGDSAMSFACSERLCKRFREAIEMKTRLNNYHIVNNGANNPIYLKKDCLYYKLFNSRIQVTIE
jgi:hypothetical protein